MPLTNEKLKELYLAEHNCVLEQEYTGGYDFQMEFMTTADDYEVYFARHTGEDVAIDTHIYYYANDLIEVLKEKIQECDKVYCGEDLYLELDPEWHEWCEDEDLIEYDDETEEYVIADKEE